MGMVEVTIEDLAMMICSSRESYRRMTEDGEDVLSTTLLKVASNDQPGRGMTMAPEEKSP
jgi:hypothetical protein